MRAMKAVGIFVVAALIISLATPAFAIWISPGLFFGWGGYRSGVGVGVGIGAGPINITPASVRSASSPVETSPSQSQVYPSGNFYRPQPYGNYSQPTPYGNFYR